MEEKVPITHSQKFQDWKIIAAVAGGMIVLAGLILLFFKVILPKIRARKSQPE